MFVIIKKSAILYCHADFRFEVGINCKVLKSKNATNTYCEI